MKQVPPRVHYTMVNSQLDVPVSIRRIACK